LRSASIRSAAENIACGPRAPVAQAASRGM
jgi:hypothetical protein